ncbi:hypothetical protein OFM36_36940, partial [Escherichia coli]|nr:hypothetical protein [Escherichia coli]
ACRIRGINIGKSMCADTKDKTLGNQSTHNISRQRISGKVDAGRSGRKGNVEPAINNNCNSAAGS